MIRYKATRVYACVCVDVYIRDVYRDLFFIKEFHGVREKIARWERRTRGIKSRSRRRIDGYRSVSYRRMTVFGLEDANIGRKCDLHTGSATKIDESAERSLCESRCRSFHVACTICWWKREGKQQRERVSYGWNINYSRGNIHREIHWIRNKTAATASLSAIVRLRLVNCAAAVSGTRFLIDVRNVRDGCFM